MAGNRDDLVIATPAGLYCPPGDFHIDPTQAVPRAVITHGHSDHAHAGMGCYYTAAPGVPILRWRLGEAALRAFDYGETFALGGTRVSLHAAGHVLGSAQVRIECEGRVWVVSGDYKRQPDPTCAPFEPLRCETFMTESTFALPVYRWPDMADVVRDILVWRDDCAAQGETAVLFCYALGKAQRLLAELGRYTDKPVLLHGAIAAGVEVYRTAGVELPGTVTITAEERGRDFAGELVLAPPSAAGSAWMRRFRRVQTGFASGWMQLRGNRRRRNVDRGFVVSDHADWQGLLHSIAQTGASRVVVMHGAGEPLVRLLRERGLDAATLTAAPG